MPKKRLLASLAIVAGLGVGGLAGVVVGIPTVAGAQTTTTVPPTGDPATPATPAEPGTPDPTRPRGENCPDKGGESDGATGSSADAAVLHRGPGIRGGAATSPNL
jgi:hypothetical protein